MAFGDRLRQGGLLGGERLSEGISNIRQEGRDRLRGGRERLREGLGGLGGGGLFGAIRGRRDNQAAVEAAAADAQDPSLTPTNDDIVASGMGAGAPMGAGYSGSNPIPPELQADAALLRRANGPNGRSFSPLGSYENPKTQAPKKSVIPADEIVDAVSQAGKLAATKKKSTPKFWPKTTKDQYHSSGSPETMTSEESGKTVKTENVDEGEFSKIHYKIPERPFVRAQSTSDKYQEGEKFWLND